MNRDRVAALAASRVIRYDVVLANEADNPGIFEGVCVQVFGATPCGVITPVTISSIKNRNNPTDNPILQVSARRVRRESPLSFTRNISPEARLATMPKKTNTMMTLTHTVTNLREIVVEEYNSSAAVA